jgi:sec-independent protein translocase protein TatB
MFDIAFSEIAIIMVVALVVIGPDRLPAVARTMGKWMGGMQRYINRVKMDINSSMELDELRELERKVKAETEALERSVQQAGNDISQQMQKLEKEIDPSAQDASGSTPSAEPPLPLK